ncbi:hypothetical protein CP533_4980 [Ophiocordyceps camponoti-saundersi (nom. inval.)]|nr:hypothetical protein CP533_4980 [Ophiocordyceps camponoti-saundersi (nom. inval.)]
MKLSIASALVLAAGQNSLATALKADIRADSNRDGKVDIESSTDLAGKHEWSDTAGAIFLSNIGDTDRRCSQMKETSEDPMTRQITLLACHDAADDVQRAPHLMAPIRTVPMQGLNSSAVGTISVSDDLASQLVRVFRPKGEGKCSWEIVTNETTFSAEHLSRGLRLGIDARATRGFSGYTRSDNGTVQVRDGPAWDGRATVRFTVTDGTETSTDSVVLRVAPVLSHHHLQEIDTVMTNNASINPDDAPERKEKKKDLQAMISGLEQSMKKAGIKTPLYLFKNLAITWGQDYFEPGYQSMPGPNGTVGLRILMIPHYGEKLAESISRELRATGIGAIVDPSQPNRNSSSKDHPGNIDGGGNLETIPPYEHNGKKYPAGRVIMGGTDEQGKSPYMLPYIQAQEAQDPLLVDSLWLDVRHIDEFLQFVPANTSRGWYLMYADADAAVDVLRDAQKRGFGGVKFERAPKRDDNPDHRETINDFLSSDTDLEAIAESAQHVRKAVDLLKSETGLSEEETFGVPVLFRRHILYPYERPGFVPFAAENSTAFNASEAKGPQRRAARHRGMSSIYPNAINGLVLTGSHYVAPKQYGPLVDGSDIMEERVRSVYAGVGFDVDFIEDLYFARQEGDVHCATNTFRDVRRRWWL